MATMNQPPKRAFSKLPIVGMCPVSIHRQATRIVWRANPTARTPRASESVRGLGKIWPWICAPTTSV
jgi:hypothetical protein